MDKHLRNVFTDRHSDKIAVALIICFWFLLYGQATSFGFVWDDRHYLLSYGWYLQDDFLVKAFTTASYLDNYYRPLGVALIHSELRWLSAPNWLHAVSLMIALLNGLLIYSIINMLTNTPGEEKSSVPALAGALLYLSHPALIESTVWISAQFDLFVTFFLLMLIRCDLRARKFWSKFFLALFFYSFAAMSKEMAASFLFSLLLFHLFLDWSGYREKIGGFSMRMATYLGILLGGLGYVFIRYLALGYLVNTKDASPAPSDFLLLAKALYHYLQIIIFPFVTISPVHEFGNQGSTDFGTWLTIFLVVVAILAAITKRSKLALVFLAFVVAIFPVLNVPLLPSKASMLSDRYLTFPLALLFIMLTLYFMNLLREGRISARVTGYIVAALIVASSIAVFHYAKNWKNNLSLWQWAYQRQPDSVLAASNYAGALLSYGHLERARIVAERLLREHPHGTAAINLGKIHLLTGNLPLAKKYFELAGAFPLVNNGQVKRLTGLAIVSLKQGDYRTAEKNLEEALKINRNIKSTIMYRAYAFYLQGKEEEAKRYLQENDIGIGRYPFKELDYIFKDRKFVEKMNSR
ncbi:tetratricopeptide repeat protein [Thiolapillus sp.]